jgi:hypothetical protein
MIRRPEVSSYMQSVRTSEIYIKQVITKIVRPNECALFALIVG